MSGKGFRSKLRLISDILVWVGWITQSIRRFILVSGPVNYKRVTREHAMMCLKWVPCMCVRVWIVGCVFLGDVGERRLFNVAKSTYEAARIKCPKKRKKRREQQHVEE